MQIDFNHFLGIVPGTAGICHIQSLKQTKDRYRNQIAGKQRCIKAGKGNRKREDDDENVQHAFLRINRADFDHALGILNRRCLVGIQLDVLLNVVDRAISTGRNRLHRSAREPVNDRAAQNQAEQNIRIQQVQLQIQKQND